MAYSQKRSYSKKRVYKKGSKSAKKYVKKSGVKKLVKLIKNVTLKQSETKTTHKIEENININHNSGYIFTNLLKTQQGITDTDTGLTAFSNRIGDEIIARGMSFKLWIANKKDRPSVMYRMGIIRYQANSIPTLSQIFTGANGNKIMDKLDKEYISVVYQKIFNLQNNVAFGDVAHTRETHTYKKIWINLKNRKILYQNGGSTPKFYDYAFFIVPYDSYGTLTTDNIASFAYEHQFYFKDL